MTNSLIRKITLFFFKIPDCVKWSHSSLLWNRILHSRVKLRDWFIFLSRVGAYISTFQPVSPPVYTFKSGRLTTFLDIGVSQSHIVKTEISAWRLRSYFSEQHIDVVSAMDRMVTIYCRIIWCASHIALQYSLFKYILLFTRKITNVFFIYIYTIRI